MTEVENYDEVDWSSLTMAKDQKSWEFMKDGKKVSGSQKWVEVYMANGEKLAFNFPKMHISKELYVSPDQKMSASFDVDEKFSAEVEAKLDSKLKAMLFRDRKNLFGPNTQLGKMTIIEQFMGYKGVISKGNQRDEKDESKGFWPDSIRAAIPTKKRGKQVVPDESMCQIFDTSDKPYGYANLDQRSYEDVILQVDKIVYDDTTASVRLIWRRGTVVGQKAGPLAPKKRKGVSQDEPTTTTTQPPAAATPADAPATANTPAANASTTEEPPSKKRALNPATVKASA